MHIRGKPDEVLKLIDEYSELYSGKEDMFIHIANRAPVIIEEMKKVDIKVMAELGAYIGYSAIAFAKELKNDGKYYSFEMSEEYANISKKLVDLAGLGDKVEFIVGSTGKTLPEFFKKNPDIGGVDFFFVDHEQDDYCNDLRILETVGAIKKGTVLVADNIFRPGAPEYHKYVTSSPEWKKQFVQEIPNPQGKEYLGRPDFVYETHLIDDQDVVGIDVTTCTST